MRQEGKENINTKEWWDEFFKEERFVVNHSWRADPYRRIIKCIDWTKVNNCTVYDIGCAFGDGLHFLWATNKNNKYIGIDFSEECIFWAKQKYSSRGFLFEVGDVYDLELKDADVIVIAETLEHLENDMEIVEKLRKMCKMLIITVPYNELNKTKGKLHDAHVNYYDENSFPGAKVFNSNYIVAIYGYEDFIIT